MDVSRLGNDPVAMHVNLAIGPSSGNVGEEADNESQVSTSQHSQKSTRSSQGRKLRQVLQKKQLDVLLQTYSSFIEEADESALSGSITASANGTANGNSNSSNDYYTIGRKNSIEGNFSPIYRIADILERKTADKGEEQADNRNNAIIRARLRSSKSLIEDDDDRSASREHRELDLSSHDCSNDALVLFRNKSKGAFKGRIEEGRKINNKKVNATKKQRKRLDFKTRMKKAGDVLKEFATRANQKQAEIAVDFHVASKEIRRHVKDGANVLFEDIADHFDGIVENLFLGETEQRDDAAAGLRPYQKQVGGQSDSCQRAGSDQAQRESNCQRDEYPSIQLRSHKETIEVMTKQVSELLQPVISLVDDLNCRGGSNELLALS